MLLCPRITGPSRFWQFCTSCLARCCAAGCEASSLENNQSIKAQIWDTAGQERYRAVASSYYRGAVGALIVYDITNHKTFMNVDNWVQELKQKGPKGMVVLLVGNKTDLADEQRRVPISEVKQYS